MKKIDVQVGIDLSMRSSAICLSTDEKVYEFFIYQPQEKIYEKLIIENIDFYETLLKHLLTKYNFTKVNIEGLSLNSKSAVLDIICTNHWTFRMILYKLGFEYNTPAPREWRKHFNIQDGRKIKDLKVEFGVKFWKVITFAKLNKRVEKDILTFCSDNDLIGDSRYDLADSYFISRF